MALLGLAREGEAVESGAGQYQQRGADHRFTAVKTL